MASLLARALTEDHPQGEESDPPRAIDRVLLGTFWRPSLDAPPATVISIQRSRTGVRTPPSRG